MIIRPHKKTVDFRTRYGRKLKKGWQSYSRQLNEELWFDNGDALAEDNMRWGRCKRLSEKVMCIEPLAPPFITLLKKGEFVMTSIVGESA